MKYGLKPELGFGTPRQMEAKANTTREQSKKREKVGDPCMEKWRSREKKLFHNRYNSHVLRVFIPTYNQLQQSWAVALFIGMTV